MRRNWIQFNTRGPRACRQAHCLPLARLASPPYHLSDLCLCAPGACVCVSVCACLCVCVFARVHVARETGAIVGVRPWPSCDAQKRREERKRGAAATAAAAQTLKNKPELCHLGEKARQAWWVFVAPPRSFHREPRLLFITARAVFTVHAGMWWRV